MRPLVDYNMVIPLCFFFLFCFCFTLFIYLNTENKHVKTSDVITCVDQKVKVEQYGGERTLLYKKKEIMIYSPSLILSYV